MEAILAISILTAFTLIARKIALWICWGVEEKELPPVRKGKIKKIKKYK